MHPSFGILTPEEFKACVTAPAGGALEIIRRKDPLYGYGTGAPLKKYKVSFTREVTFIERASTTVEAENEDHVKTICNTSVELLDSLDWERDDFGNEILDHEVANIEEI